MTISATGLYVLNLVERGIATGARQRQASVERIHSWPQWSTNHPMYTHRQTDRQTERERDDDDDDDGDDRRRSPARCTRLRCEAVDKRS